MKTTKILLALTAVNCVLLVTLLAHGFGQANAQDGAQMLRGRGLEIVDDQGRVRASISILADTVLLRLITERGRPSVKIGASEPVSGLSFAGPTGTKDTWLILEARDKMTSLRLRNEDGSEHVVKP
jgi:hypothetical protein